MDTVEGAQPTPATISSSESPDERRSNTMLLTRPASASSETPAFFEERNLEAMPPFNHVCDNTVNTNVIHIRDEVPFMDTLSQRLVWARERLKLSQDEVAKKAGVSQGTIGNAEAGIRKQPRELDAIARALGVHYQWLKEGKGPIEADAVEKAPKAIVQGTLRRVPVVGTAQLGLDGYYQELEYPVGHGDGFLEVPTTDPNAYAVRCRGSSMEPAIRDRWFCCCEPNSLPVPNEFVHVKLKDGRYTIKELLYARPDELAIRSVNTQEMFKFTSDEVEFVHHIGYILPPSKWKL